MNDSELIFQIGLSRAGTQTLTEALNILGYKTAHEFVDSVSLYFKHRETPIPFESCIRDGYNCFLDMMFLTNLDVEILYSKFPNSKFIYLHRDYNSWVRSISKLEAADRVLYPINLINQLYEERLLLKSEKEFDDRTLIMEISNGDGWEKLCPFLGKEIPNGEFPNVDFLRPISSVG